jgi:hypothetical protein
MVAVFTCAIVPTGKYFISVGSMDGLVFAYWYLLLYFVFFARTAFYTWRVHFIGLVVTRGQAYLPADNTAATV